MPKRHIREMDHESAETGDKPVSIEKMPEDAQITINDTGWSEEEKERMKKYGYDGIDMVRAWYS